MQFRWISRFFCKIRKAMLYQFVLEAFLHNYMLSKAILLCRTRCEAQSYSRDEGYCIIQFYKCRENSVPYVLRKLALFMVNLINLKWTGRVTFTFTQVQSCLCWFCVWCSSRKERESEEMMWLFFAVGTTFYAYLPEELLALEFLFVCFLL